MKNALNSFEVFTDSFHGLYIIKKNLIPASECQMSKTLWISKSALIYEKREGVPVKVQDIIKVSGKANGTENVSLALKSATTICGRHARHTALDEVFVVELAENDQTLDDPFIHAEDADRWLGIKS